jgi:hypothetical protein
MEVNMKVQPAKAFWLPAILALPLCAAPAHAQDFLEDGRTAKAVSFSSPRASLKQCLRVLSETSKVSLSASPALAEEQLTGYVPRRPLRETMDALAELYDATWTTVAGSPRTFRLDPDPVKAKAGNTARAGYLARLRKALDDEAGEALKEARNTGLPGDTEGRQRTRKFGMVLWAVLPPAERDKVLRGVPYTLSLPEPAAKPVYQMLLTLTEKDDQKLLGPMLITYDLDEKGENMLPQLRARATAMRENSIIGAFGVLDLTSLAALPKAPEIPEVGNELPALPTTIGENGRFVGTRDELVSKVGEGCNLPVLSRHRALPDSTYGLNAAGRRAPQLIGDLARQCDSTYTLTSRGFYLIRSNSAIIDSLYLPPANVVEAYLKTRPAKEKRVPFALESELAAMSPIQLKILQRSNLCSEDAEFAYDTYGLLRFYRLLNPEQRKQLFSVAPAGVDVAGGAQAGLDAATLGHAALHAFLDERTKRGDLNIYGELQEIKGLRIRFAEYTDKRENTFVAQGLRGAEIKTTATRELAQVDEEYQVTAK